jgi:hypothetical protein
MTHGELTARQIFLSTMTEAEFQNGIVAQARTSGYRVHFVPDTLYRRSFSGKHKGHGLDLGDRGFPDLLIVRNGSIHYRELKIGRNKLDAEQESWRDELLAAGQDWRLWHGNDYDELMEAIRNDVCLRR